MHSVQKNIVALLELNGRIPFSLRGIGRRIGGIHPQNVKYHLMQLQEKGLIHIDEDNKEVTMQNRANSNMVLLPMFGSANCGSPTSIADGTIEGYVKLSPTLLSHCANQQSCFVVNAIGDSMNACNIAGKNIEDGDYVIVEQFSGMPKEGEVVVSIIDGSANIKRFHHNGTEVVLSSISTKDYPPIFIHSEDSDMYHVAGRVVEVLKKPQDS